MSTTIEFRRRRKRHGGIELTPLIDVVFLLIVFLILTANFQMPSLSLALPGGVSKDEAAEDVVLVELAADGTVALNGVEIDKESFPTALEAALAPLELRAVRLRADEKVEYGALLPVIELARSAGAKAVDLVHEGR